MKVSKEVRKNSRQLFQASFTDGKLDEGKVRAIVAKVASAKPRNYIDVLGAYQRYVRLEVAKRHAVVESAAQLDAATTARLTDTLRGKYGSDLSTEFKVSPELIGGLRIKIGSDVWDGSVQHRIARLEDELLHA